MQESFRAWFVGEGSLLVQAAERWLERGHTIAGVASREGSIRAWAAEHELALVEPGALLASAGREPFDYLFSVVNLTMLSGEVLALPRKMAVNFHDGYLPRYAGVNATVWALLNDEISHGVTWHEMTRTADEGRILVQRAFEVAPDETAFSLNAKCFAAGIETFREVVERIGGGTLALLPQNLQERTYFDFYDRPDALCVLGFGDAKVLERTVRALDFGTYPNPVGAAKVLAPAGPILVGQAEVLDSKSGRPPGAVLSAGDGELVVATGTSDVRLARLRSARGAPQSRAELAALGAVEGAVLKALSEAERAHFTELGKRAARSEGAHLRRLLAASPLALGGLGTPEPSASAPVLEALVPVPDALAGERLPALLSVFLARHGGVYELDLAYADPAIRESADQAPGLFAREVPLRISLDPLATAGVGLTAAEHALRSAGQRPAHLLDLFARDTRARQAPFPVALLVDVELDGALPAGDVAFLVDTRQKAVRIAARVEAAAPSRVARLAERIGLFFERSLSESQGPLGQVPLVSAGEERRILNEWNATERAVPSECLHARFEAQARLTPSAVAVTARGESLTYRELDERANALALELVERGVVPDTLVGVCLDRSVHLLVAVLGILKAGGAYVPLDPTYPKDRLRFMLADARLSLVVTDRQNQGTLGAGSHAEIVADADRSSAGNAAAPSTGVTSENLAYVIYTSGSTGTPKGVMVEHRNVVNFLVAMDDVIRPEQPGTWLAVTSLSFDISVLELLWTVTRGFHVVVYAGQHEAVAKSARPLDFSLFYFSSDESGGGPAHYRLLLEGARFADEHGFAAVWTPERHFHAFGGLYPNPAVTSAALAMITRRVALRAGSCVSPLHSPIRIAEEWSLVDNLSNGRVGISFAAGWQPNDFCIRPEAFVRRKEQMFEDIETVRRLWRGEHVTFKNGIGKDTAVSILPRPVQRELPIWVTAAGNPETFEGAGRVGAHLLTHLLGQSFAELEEKVRVYRAAWEKAGHPGRGVVTLMLHTFIGADDDSVKETVRAPMKEYLKSAVGLIKEAAWSFPTFKEKVADGSFSPESLSPEEMDALLDFAFERYYRTSGLFGSVETALETVELVRRADVDEIACLVDFGVPAEQALAHLPELDRVRERASAKVASAAQGETVGELLARHRVTHFQCTPSMASMLVLDAASRAGLARLEMMLVGGEALAPSLCSELTALLSGALVNVYGPTETTVWSTSHRLERSATEVCIGTPLANTEVLILDAAGALVPPGDEGELVIGGKGVVRGYLHRPELTEERFIRHPFRPDQRAYRTGDLASFGEDGVLRFKGRLDHQVKLRGYRIELGEIEARLAEHPTVRECVVVAREDVPGDQRLVAYVIAQGKPAAPAELSAHLGASLPSFMLPSAFVFLQTFPQTPNKKTDRKALPAPDRVTAPLAAREGSSAPAATKSALEETIAGIWREVLGRSEVGVTDNFFDLGGHSLLTIRVLGKLKDKVTKPLSLVDLFRHPTIRSLAGYLESSADGAEDLDDSAARGAERQRIRRAMMDRRRGG